MSTDELSPLKKALLAVQKLKGRIHDLSHGPIAIVGAGLRLPGGVTDLDSYRQLLFDGVDAVREVPPDRWDVDAWYDADGAPGKMITREAGFLDDVAGFDASFFGISPREALEMDPAQRLLLVTAWEALEHAGIAPDSLSRSRTGVYVGLGLSDYGRRHFLGTDPTRMTAYSGTGAFLSVAAGRVSYSLGLEGPAVTVDTACSSSLVSIHLAVQSLRRGETDLALAGGANLILTPEPTVYFSQLDAMAADGRCKTFDARADGYVRGEGAGMVALKRLADAVADGDPILAVIRGTAVNQDGRSNGLTAPSGRAQQQVIRAALADAGLDADQIGAIEAHGTGTPLGDPIEVDALSAVFGRRQGDAPLHLGSAKTNVGHTETAAGVTGLLKLALQIHDRRIAPHLHLQQLNPRIRLDGTPLRIPTEATDWAGDDRFGGVSSFGLSGTNAHLVLGPAPIPDDRGDEPAPGRVELVPLSARGDAARAALAARWAESLAADAVLADVAHSAAVGRASLPQRLAVAARTTGEVRDALAAFARGEEPAHVVIGATKGTVAPAVGFLFTGQGAQTHGMGRALHDAEPVFAQAFDAAVAAAEPHLDGADLKAIMWGDDERLHDTRFTQPALYALQTALVALWRSWGVEPDALIGHSIGEYAAAWAAGVFSLADGMKLVCARGRLMSELPRDGAMLAIFAPETDVAPHVAEHDGVDISGINNPTETVVSGRTEGIDALQAHFEGAAVKCRRLRVSHAFHSPLMEPMLDAFEAVAAEIDLAPADRPVVSNLDGREVQSELADPAYWRRHVRHAVRFADGMATLKASKVHVFVEIGPRPVLSGMGARCYGDTPATWLPSLHPDRDDAVQIVTALGGLWCAGAHVRPEQRSDGATQRRVALPTYAWQDERYWLEPVPDQGPADPYADLALELGWRPSLAAAVGPSGRWQVRGSAAYAAALAARGAHVVDASDPTADHVLVVADGPCDVLDAAQSLGDARLHVVLPATDDPTLALDRAAAAGLAGVVGLERAGQLASIIDVTGDSSVEAVLDCVLTDDDEVRQRVRDGRRRVARLTRSRKALGTPAPVDGAWAVTGGFGSLGRRVARWLADQGATTLLLTGRSGASSEAAKALLTELEGRGVTVVEGRGDITDRDALQRMLAAVEAPLRGAVHCAGINDDAPLAEQTRDRIEAVMAPKAIGGWNLHQLLPDDAMLVLFGSASGTVGVPGQANYAAANAALDELARRRRAGGRPALSLAWGPWAGSTMVDDLGADIEALWAREGIRTLDPDEALALLGRALGGSAPAVLAADFDWLAYAESRPSATPLYDELLPAVREVEPTVEAGPALVEQLRAAPEGARAGMLRDHVQQVVGAVLGFGPGRHLGLEEGFFDAGLDSLMAVDLRHRLQRSTGAALSATVAFDHPDVRALADHLLDELDLGAAAATSVAASRHEGEAIAIVGAACRLPGGVVDLDTLWSLVADGGHGIVEVPRDRFDIDRYYDPEPGTPGRTYCRKGGFVDDIDQFDPTFFGISPREAVSLDPQQRMLLECSWHALDDAGLAANRLRETPTGVYVGIGQSEYWHRFDPTDPGDVVDAYSGTGNETSFAAGRVSYVLGLRGPAMAVNTACSSSLVSLQMAVEGLRSGACDLALAGGVNAIVGPETTLWMSMLQALAPDGHCKSFDARADGYVRSEGCGMLALKRLSDATRDGDRIHAVIRGAAVNHDGPSSGLTVPNGTAQQQVIRAALADAGVAPTDVGLVECHGTGTKLGDPIEVGAIGKVLADGRAAPLYLGAVKANLGHLEAGAGIAGVLKAVAALKHRSIPPLAGFESPNPDLPLERYPAVRLPTERTEWVSDGPRIAGVSSFGISGTNAHVVLQEAPERPLIDDATARPAHLLLVSGRTAEAAQRQAAAYRDALDRGEVRLADVATTLSHRAHLPHRLALLAGDVSEAIAGLEAASAGAAPVQGKASDPPKLVFLCTGAGPQCVGMARELYEGSEVFRDALDECARLLEPHLEQPLLDVIYPPPGQEDASPVNELAYTQPAMFAIEWAMAQLWKSWGVQPDAVIGHSTGQYIAACLAGVYDLATGLKLMATRARLMSDQPRIGTMVAVMASEETVRGYLAGQEEHVDIAAVNGPAEAVISGLSEPVNAIADRIEADGIEIRRLRISHAAHSPLMEPVLDDLERVVAEADLQLPRIPLIENVRGEVAGEELLTTAYWRDHMRHGVQFAKGMRTLAELGYRHFLEIGNHPILSGAGARTLEDLDDTLFVPSIRRKAPEWLQLLEGVGRLHAAGVAIDWAGFHAEAPGQRIGLPGTTFAKKRYWVERSDAASQRSVGRDWTYTEAWHPVRLNVDAFGARASGTLVVLADDAGLGERLVERQERPTVVIRPTDLDPADTAALAARIVEAAPAAIVSLWALDAPSSLDGIDPIEAAARGVQGALAALHAAQQVDGATVFVATRGAVSTEGEAPRLAQAPVTGLLTVAAMELPDTGVVGIDLEPEGDDLMSLELVLNAGLVEEQLAFREGQPLGRRLERVEADPGGAPPLRDDATYLVTGGLGALGLRTARWLREHGAGGIVLTGRSAPSEAAQQVVEQTGAVVLRADVSDGEAVAKLLADIAADPALPPLRGVFHAAGVLDDGALRNLDWARFAGVWGPKVRGTWHLHAQTNDLDLFVLFSSAAGYVGSAGQANYAAGNRFMDALAVARRAAEQPAVSLAWGPWAEHGLATEAKRQWTAGGVTPLPPHQGMAVLGQLLGSPSAVVAVADLDWQLWPQSLPRVPQLVDGLVVRAVPTSAEPPLVAAVRGAPEARRADVLADGIAAVVAAVLGLDAAELDHDMGFFDQGLDSLMAVEVANRLKVATGQKLPATLAFDHPTITELRDHLSTQLDLGSAPQPAAAAVQVVQQPIELDEPIAIVGVSCRMPGGANSPEAFWELLRSGDDPMEVVPAERWDIDALYDPTPATPGKMYVREAGWVDWDEVRGFDPEFFGISPREAASMDPQQRMLLEVSYEALERAGVATADLAESQTGVFVGVGDSGYLQRFQEAGGELYADTYAGTGNLSAFVSGRVAYVLGVHGPNLALNTACSSSLVATHLACQALRTGDADIALAGGVHLMLSPENFVYVSQLKALASDGRCKTFDASANGYGRAEGCGMLVLKRLSDAQRDGDPIVALIRGTAVNHDGPSSGLTVPHGPAQVQVLGKAVGRSGIDPLDVSYIECHGTGTVLGDPIEVHAIEEVYAQGRTDAAPLYLGAVKANVGHMEVAAGAASMVKMALAFQHGELPPQAHFAHPNPDLDLGGPLRVLTEPTPWQPASGKRLAGVSAFGLAGTNVHVVMEEAPAAPAPVLADDDRPAHLLTLSARSPGALRDLAVRYGEQLQRGDALADVAFSAHTTRNRFEQRLAVAGRSADEVAQRLASFVAHGEAPQLVTGVSRGRPPRVVFLFSGQGSQYPGMGAELYDAHPVFRDVIDRCAAVLDGVLDVPLREVLFADPSGDGAERIHDTTYTQPCLFALEVALAELWKSWGIEPAAVIGHSIGQLAAATVAGVFSLEDGLKLVAERGRLMGSLPRDGAMAALFAEGEVVEQAMAPHGDAIGVAARNNPGETVVSGKTEAVEAVVAALKEQGIEGRMLKVSHAFHSPLMDPILDAFEAVAAQVDYHPPRIDVLCNLTGGIAGAEQLTSPAYWRSLIREGVMFADGLRTLDEEGYDTFVEVGPHTALLGMGKRTIPDRSMAWLPSLKRKEDPWSMILPSLGALFARGVEVDWRGFDAPWPRNRVALPTYPWQHRVTWMDKPEWPQRRDEAKGWLVEEVWRPVDVPQAVPLVGYWVVVGEGPDAQLAAAALTEAGATVEPDGDLSGANGVVVVAGPDATKNTEAALEATLALADHGGQLVLLTRGAHRCGTEVVNPAHATLLGFGRVVALEQAPLRPLRVDLDPEPHEGEASALARAIMASDDEHELEVALRDGGQRYVRRLTPGRFAAEPLTLRDDGCYLVTGGLGGLGLTLARWLHDHGAKHLVLTGRSAPKPHAEDVLAELREAGCDVVVARGDVGVADDVARIVGGLTVPLRGVFHAAGVLDDAALLRQTPERVRKVANPKVQGTWNLHEATKGLDLDLFVLFSGGASLLGSPGQANYSAANAFLDAFASWRTSQGLPGLALQWGAWADVGMAASLGDAHLERQAREGIHRLPLKGGMDAMGRLLGHVVPVMGVLHVDWATFVATVHGGQSPTLLQELVPTATATPAATGPAIPAVPEAPAPSTASGLPPLIDAVVNHPREAWNEHIEAIVHDLALSVLGLDRDRELDHQQPLLDSGLDSLLAVELKNRIMDHGVDVPVARVMTGPSIAQIGQMVVNAVDEHGLAELPEEELPTEHGKAPLPAGDPKQPTAAAQAVQQAGWVPPPRPMESGSGIGVNTVIVAFILGCLVPVVAYVGTLWVVGPEETTLQNARTEMPAPEPVTEPEPAEKAEKAKGKSKGKRK